MSTTSIICLKCGRHGSHVCEPIRLECFGLPSLSLIVEEQQGQLKTSFVIDYREDAA